MGNNKQIKIAEFLGWQIDKSFKDLVYRSPQGRVELPETMNFDKDYNMLMFCIERIAVTRQSCINEVLNYLCMRHNGRDNIYTKEDLFNVILNYIDYVNPQPRN